MIRRYLLWKHCVIVIIVRHSKLRDVSQTQVWVKLITTLKESIKNLNCQERNAIWLYRISIDQKKDRFQNETLVELKLTNQFLPRLKAVFA